MAELVTARLRNALQNRLQRHQVLVWYDAKRCFAHFAEHVDLGSTRVLRLVKDNGAKRALIPIENKRHVLEVDAAIMEHVDPVFYSDPTVAARKAMGWGEPRGATSRLRRAVCAGA